MSTSSCGMYWTAAYPASLNVSAFRVSAMMRPATVTVTRAGFGSIVIGWLGPGSLIDLVSMAVVVSAGDVNQGEVCWARLCGHKGNGAHSAESAPGIVRALFYSTLGTL